ncbi:MAG TPA: phage holin family protein [Steroidobacteraceae bacterium]|jgi:uncharacterized membrane protein YqjE|nr:phage holin family protein [Steroidobacteraceae bacterium]
MDYAPQEAQAPPPESRISRFLTSFGQLLVTLVEMTYTRLELIFVELQEAIQGLVTVLLWGLVAILAAGATLVFAAVALIVAFWDTHRVLVALLVTGSFLLISLGSLWVMVLRLRSQRALFASTLSEFAKDRELMRRQRE